jgi:3'(2'), 5'-bisphosphate nucleotidase
MPNTTHPEWIEKVKAIARAAAEIIADIYHRQVPLNIQIKSDNSPLTIADMQSDAYIREQLALLTPHIPIVTEETQGTLTLPQAPSALFWLVDPLDGTKEFINRSGEFTVNIALIAGYQAILGVVALPLTQACYWAEKDKGAYFQERENAPIHLSVNTKPKNSVTIAISRSHCNEPEYTQFIEHAQSWGKEVKLLKAGSALKICLVAHGLADLYPRFGPTHAWDTAAGHIILTEAKGCLVDLTGTPLHYGQKNTFENPSFIAASPYYLTKTLALVFSSQRQL